MAPDLVPRAFDALAAGTCPIPFDVLGQHRTEDGAPGWVIRVFITWARAVTVVRAGKHYEMEPSGEGRFELRLPRARKALPYELHVTDYDNQQFELDDPYRFAPFADPSDYADFLKGTERRAQRVLGARLVTHGGAEGTCFSVWAPRVHNVNLMGEFNRWDGRCHPMRPVGDTGVWELFVPGVNEGAHYKFDVRPSASSDVALKKTDPYARAIEVRPATASRVCRDQGYQWSDADWMTTRRERQSVTTRPVSVYEVHLGSWKRHPGADPAQGHPGWLSYRELAHELIPYVRDLGFTHIELLPVAEHPLDGSWGYQVLGFFAPTSRFGSPDDLRYFIDTAHQHGIGVLVDWVPAHFPRDAAGLARFTGYPLYEYADPRKGSHPDWGTLVFDYGRPEVVSFLISNAIYWLEAFHVDGLRVDAVASMLYLDYSRDEGQWTPNKHGGREHLEAIEMIRQMTDAVHDTVPGALLVAEESTSWPGVTHPTGEGGLGFDLKWNMGWMHDTLEVMQSDPLFRKALYEKLTFAMWYQQSEHFLLPLSHDEVVHLKGSLLGKMPGAEPDKLANLRLLFAYMWMHPGKKLLFMGGELGQHGEWNFEGELEWARSGQPGYAGLATLVEDLNELYVTEPALGRRDQDAEGFEWLDCHDAARTTLSFVRWKEGWTEPILVAANFTPVAWEAYQLAAPVLGTYELVLNTASARYDTDNTEELPVSLETVEGELHSRPGYLEFNLPGLAVTAFKLSRPAAK